MDTAPSRADVRTGISMTVIGLGLVVLFLTAIVAVCDGTCTTDYPWPLLGAGLALVVAGLVVWSRAAARRE